MQFQRLAREKHHGYRARDGSAALAPYKTLVPRKARVPRSLTAGGAEARSGLIGRLRGAIRAIEQVPVSLAAPPTVDTGARRPACSFSPWTFGVEEIDRALPWAGLAVDGLHEIRPVSYSDSWAALGLALALLVRRKAGDETGRPFLWVLSDHAAREFGTPHAPGLAHFGLDPQMILIARVRQQADFGWALEEGLKSRALGAVLGQGTALSLLEGKRLALATRNSRTPCLLLSGHRGSGLGPALTRWRVSTAASTPSPFNASAPGAPCWRLALERCRYGTGGRTWTLEWNYDAYRFHLAAPLADRTAERGGGAEGAVAAGR